MSNETDLVFIKKFLINLRTFIVTNAGPFTIVTLLLIACIFGLIRFFNWVPSEPEILRSVVGRNYGLVIVGIIGFIFAYWRGWQTERQIDELKKQHASESQKIERETFATAVDQTTSEQVSVQATGFILLSEFGLDRDSRYQDPAQQYLRAWVRERDILDGKSYQISIIFARGFDSFHNESRKFYVKDLGIIVKRNKSDHTFVISRIINVTIKNDYNIKTFNFEKSLIRRSSFEKIEKVHFNACVVDLNSLNFEFVEHIFFRNCRILNYKHESTARMYFEDCSYLYQPSDDEGVDLSAEAARAQTGIHPKAKFEPTSIGGDQDPVILRRIKGLPDKYVG